MLINKGLHLKDFREKKSLTQQNMADMLEISLRTYINYENSNTLNDKICTFINAKLAGHKTLPLLQPDPNGKKIPYFEGQAFATISPSMADVVALRPDTFIHIPMFSQGEFALQVTGHSMRPYISHGDFVVVKRIMNREAIIYDEPYMVVTKEDNLKTVKFVKEHKDKKKLWLVPYNIEQFNEQSILKEDILEMYRVVGLFRTV
jgi:DNA-binding XRE family transcriptional regulator